MPTRSSMRWPAPLLTALLLVVPTGASSLPFEVAEIGLRLDIAPRGGQVCVLHPSALFDPVACQPLGFAPGDALVDAEPTLDLLAYVSAPGAEYALAAVRAPRLGRWPDEDDLLAFQVGIAEAVRAELGYDADVEAERLEVGNVPAIRAEAAVAVPDRDVDTPTRLLAYLLVGRDHSVLIRFETDEAFLAGVREDATATVGSVMLPAPDGGPRGSTAYQLGRIVGMVLMVLLVALIVVRISRRSVKRGRRAADTEHDERPSRGDDDAFSAP